MVPCEIEGISIAAAIKFFDGYIIQSKKRTQVLTDSKPCVEAYEKLFRGQFSTNARLSTFLSAASRHHIVVQHLSGAANLPSDFASRNPYVCTDQKCQICCFVNSLDECVVRNLAVQDVIDGRCNLPFISRKAWLVTQSECRDLRRTRAHLLQGTRPSKKENTIRSVKRYLNKVTIASDGLLIVKCDGKLSPQKETIVIPSDVLPGLLTALHLRLDHPSISQLSKIVKRYFWALNLDSALESTSATCHTCASLRKIPSALEPQSTSDPPPTVGVQFAADVIRRERQKILVMREYVSCFTRAVIIESEDRNNLREGLIATSSELIPLDGPLATVRTDPAPGFISLIGDETLAKHRLQIEIGRHKNVNKNPVGEKAVQEVQEEILKVSNTGGPISCLILNLAISRLNCRIRTDGLSAREIFFQRDQFTNEQIPVSDIEITRSKFIRTLRNNASSEISKSAGHGPRVPPVIEVGDLVYLYIDRDKNSPRCRYIVVSVEGEWCSIRKFVGNTLKANSYRVKLVDVYKVAPTTLPTTVSPHLSFRHEDDSDFMSPTSEPTLTTSVQQDANIIQQNDSPQVPATLHSQQQDIDNVPEVSTDWEPMEVPVVAEHPISHSLHQDSTPPEVLVRPEPLIVTSQDTTDTTTSPPSPPLRRSTRSRKPPARFLDYVA